MNSRRRSAAIRRSCAEVFYAFCLVCVFSADQSFAQTSKQSDYSVDPADKEECQKHLNIIYEAVQEYIKAKKDLPRWLSDLTPEFLYDPQVLRCPFIERIGDAKSSRRGILDVVFSDQSTSYSYEFCQSNLPPRLWAGTPKTYRDYKMRQMDVVGSIVPIVRCMGHRPMLNLSYGGHIYETTNEYWEALLPIPQSELYPGPLFADQVESRESLVRRLPPRSPNTPPELMDLSDYYNHAITDRWIPQRPNQDLSAVGSDIHELGGVPFDVRGVLQLRAKPLGPPFPSNVTIRVQRRCRNIWFLHGTVFAAPGTNVATFVINYADAQSIDIPLIYGRDVMDVAREPETPVLEDVGADESQELLIVNYNGTRLYRRAWVNPRPDVLVESIRFRSGLAGSAPFLLAITTELRD